MSLASTISPVILPETVEFWSGIERDTLRIQRCVDCGHRYFPPAPVCPSCTSKNVEWMDASGQATLYSYTLAQNPWPDWDMAGPVSVALVELEEGPRLVSTVVDCEQTPQALQLDMALHATSRTLQCGRKMLCFRPEMTAT